MTVTSKVKVKKPIARYPGKDTLRRNNADISTEKRMVR